jgi:glycosyltransferase involved in cell wall biosynthesis
MPLPKSGGVFTYFKQGKKMTDKKGLWVIKAGFPNTPAKKQWSDYAFANTLKTYLEKNGHRARVDSRDEWYKNGEADVVIALRGPETYFPDRSNKDCIYILWNLSHPSTVTEEEYNSYDLVCTGSSKKEYADGIKKQIKVPLKILPMCVDTELFYPSKDPWGEKEYGWVFVGNSRNMERKGVSWAIENGIPIKIWGANWKDFIPEPEKYVVADNIPNSELPNLYRNAKATIDDHYEDMLENGFINTRILEALACGLPVFSDYSKMLTDLFGDAVFCCDNAWEVKEQIEKFDSGYDKIKEKVLDLWPLIQAKYSFYSTVKKLEDFVLEIKKEGLKRAAEEPEKEIDFSVIIPVCNGEAYLENTLLSLQNQTLKNIEIICADDGSTDGTPCIIEKFAAADKRIRSVRLAHRGAGAARNIGLSRAKGKYVIFLDADDSFSPDLLEKVYEKGRRTQAEVLLFGAKRCDDRTGEITEAPWYLRREMLPETEIFSRRDMDGRLLEITSPAPWTKAFDREFLLKNKLKFQELRNSNDVFFVLTALALADKISAVDEDLVCYRFSREGSLQDKKSDNPLCFLEAYCAVYDELNKRGIYAEVEKGFCNTVISGCIYNLDSVKREDAKWKIISALCSEKFTGMGILDHEDDYYRIPENKYRLKGLKYALETRQKRERRYDALEERGVKECDKEITPKVSVIIPVCNTEKYLRECLDSIISQSLRDIEIICIDDGSFDSSPEILIDYAKRDKRIGIWSQENSGLSVARNKGLSHARGEYVYFLDSDDTLEPDALLDLYSQSKKEELDVLYFNGNSVYEQSGIKENYPEFEEYYLRKGDYSLCTGSEMFLKMKSLGEYRVNMGIQFIRREFLVNEGFNFYPGILHEDNDFSLRAMLLAGRVGYNEGAYFNRRLRRDSIMTAQVGFDHVYGYFRSFLNMLKFAEENPFPEEISDALYEVMRGVLDNAKSCYTKLSREEKYAALGLCGMERICFKLYVEDETESYGKLKKAYAEKSEINRKLQKTYAEKSEINRKLQITYREKYERGQEIKKIKNSRTYRLARAIGFPVRLLRRIKNKITGGRRKG